MNMKRLLTVVVLTAVVATRSRGAETPQPKVAPPVKGQCPKFGMALIEEGKDQIIVFIPDVYPKTTFKNVTMNEGGKVVQKRIAETRIEGDFEPIHVEANDYRVYRDGVALDPTARTSC